MSPDMKQFYDSIRDTIQKAGFQIIGVGGDGKEPGFHYTIGLHEKFGFEIVVFALPYNIGGVILNTLVADFGQPALDVPNTDLTNLPVMFKECDWILAKPYVNQAYQYYQHDLKVVQMVLSDREGRLPGNPQFDRAYMAPLQPLLYRK